MKGDRRTGAHEDDQRDRRLAGWLAALRLGAGALALVCAGFWLGVWFGPRFGMETATRTALPNLGPAPSYSLTDQSGRTVNSRDFAGKVQIVTFLFPYCRTYCPLIAAHLVGLERLLEAAKARNAVEIVAFNLAPNDAGPVAMRSFLKQYGWKPADTHWEYLTGPAREIRRVVTGGFHVAYDRVAEQAEGTDGAAVQTPQPEVVNPLAAKAHVDYDISHNDALVIVDAQGRIRRIYDQADVLPNDQLWRTIQSLLPAQPS